MDRTSLIGLVACIVLLIGVEWYTDKYYPAPKTLPKPAASATTNAPGTIPPAEMTSATPAPGTPASTIPASKPAIEEKFTVVENDAMKVTFTNLGGAITEVELKMHSAENGGNIVLNEGSHANVLSIAGWPGLDTVALTAQENPGHGVIYSGDLPNGLKWQRTYAFHPEVQSNSGMSGFLRRVARWVGHKFGETDPKPQVYAMDVTDTLANPGTTDVALPNYSLSLGRAEPLYDPPAKGSDGPVLSAMNAQYLGSGWLTNKFHLTTLSDFAPSWFFFVFKSHDARDLFTSTSIDPLPLRWIGVENQFYTVLLTPAVDKSIVSGSFQTFNRWDANGNLTPPHAVPDIEAAANFAGVTVPAGKSVSLAYNLYAGPKDFNRLDQLGQNQGALMNYDGILPFSFLIVPMLTVLNIGYAIFHNYGVAIIMLTLIIKALTWKLQSIANRSGKKMQALAPMLKEVQAKYKDQPEKLQQETFALYKDYGVNPFGGCLPALVQMPVFFSLYFMLQNAVELRGQSFLWVHDLTRPDSVWTAPFLVMGWQPSLHPLPIMVTALTMVMMRMTPQIGDPTQAKVAQIMPLFFLFIFYNFAAALSLYYVINNAVSIIQIYRNLKKPLPELKRLPRKKAAGR